MALDVYVMPLWRFKAGDFTSPIEETLGLKPTVVSLSEPFRPRPPWYLRLLAWMHIIHFVEPEPPENPTEARERAIQEVDALKIKLTSLTGQSVDWQDVGNLIYNQQYHHPIVMRAFAAWHDHREAIPSFTRAPEGDYHQHPAWKIPRLDQPRFPTLLAHSLHTGYFLPVPFAGCYKVEPFVAYGAWTMHRDVAATQTILDELVSLLNFMATVPEVKSTEDGSNPVADARWYAEELQRICLLSIEHGLPVIFYG